MAANPIDLTTVALVNDWLNQAETVDAAIIQSAITNFSKVVQLITSRTNLAGASPIPSFSEVYSGNGSEILFVRNYPVTAVSSLAIDGVPIPQSPGVNQVGWVIDTSGSQAAIALRGGSRNTVAYSAWSPGQWGGNGNAPPLGQRPFVFNEGIMNVEISYSAGYAATPFDLQQAATQLVAAKYRSRQWIEQTSQMQPNVGTTAYSKLEIPNDVQMLLDRYRMRFIPS